jgi:hypothetical protein
MLWAPEDPPVTISAGCTGSRPRAARAAVRAAALSRPEIAVRIGMPTCVACGSGVLSKATATRLVIMAPTLLARPGRALASWITMGILRLRAARYMGVQT